VALQRSMFETTTDTAVVRLAQQKWWQEIIPAKVSELFAGLTANDSSSEQMPDPFAKLQWRSRSSPDTFARLNVPKRTDASIEEEELALSIWASNPEQATLRKKDLQGMTARIGSRTAEFDQTSYAVFRLRDLRTSLDGLLWISFDSQPWELVIE